MKRINRFKQALAVGLVLAMAVYGESQVFAAGESTQLQNEAAQEGNEWQDIQELQKAAGNFTADQDTENKYRAIDSTEDAADNEMSVSDSSDYEEEIPDQDPAEEENREPVIQASLSEDETECLLTLKNYSLDVNDYITTAVWSAAEGQDDLRWYTMSDGAEDSACTVKIGDHRSSGLYFVHSYIHRSDGTMEFQCKTEFSVSKAVCTSVDIEEIDREQGSCRIVVRGVTAPSGIRQITVPVWSRPDQSDIQWYPAEKLSEDTYAVEMHTAEHNYNSGTYQIHVYAESETGIMEMIGKTTVDFPAVPVSISADSVDGGFSVKAGPIPTGNGVNSVLFAVWSEENGQDDLKWITGSYKASKKTASTIIRFKNFKHKSNLIVHAYLQDSKGSMHFLGNTELEYAVDAKLSIEEQKKERIYQVAAADVKCPYEIESLFAAVWSEKNGQDDLEWVSMKQGADGSFTGTVDISRHKTEGDYFVHVYAQTKDGQMVFLGSCEGLAVNPSANAEITVEDGNAAGEFRVGLTFRASSEISSVLVPVWCAEDQSDIRWYSAVKTGENLWSAEVNAANHGFHTGNYKIHVYTVLANGIQIFAGNTEKEVKEASRIAVIRTGEKGKRKIIFHDSSRKISAVQFPVWSGTNGQDDLVWYNGKKNSAGDWEAVFDVKKHKHSGTYIVHVYANGMFSGNTEFTVDYEDVKNAYTEIASGLKAAESNQQLILVKASGNQAILSMLNKESDGTWMEFLRTDAYVGINGVGETTEWNQRTPKGVYSFGTAFGILPNPGTAFSYTKVNSSHYWVDDVDSKYYNQFVSTNKVALSWKSAEHLIDYSPQYHYALSINYNPECVPGAGSAIFLHCWRGVPTLGCVAIPEAAMKKVLQNVRTDCKIIIDNGDAIKNY